jgi:hypothetical protein
MKSWIAKKSTEAQQAARVAELEKANVQLGDVEHCEWALTSIYEDLKKDFGDVRSSHAVVVREQVDKTECAKLQRFQDSLRKGLAELQRDTEALVAVLGGRCAEFPSEASMPDFLEWIWAEVAAMPIAFTKCNKNISCYALISIFQLIVREGCEHFPELKKLALSCDASLLQDFSADVGRIAKKLVKNRWTKHGLPYSMQKIKEENRVSSATLIFGK